MTDHIKTHDADDDKIIELGILRAARQYLKLGIEPVSVQPRKKAATHDFKTAAPVTLENVARRFSENQNNIGVRLGSRSGGLVDVDLDCEGAVALAPSFLPPTGRVFGRASSPRAHWLYRSDLCQTEGVAGLVFKCPTTNAVLLEIRIGAGADGDDHDAMTVAPPSIHENGEQVVWHDEGDIERVDGSVLKQAVARLAVAVLLLRDYAGNKGRHDFWRDVDGFLTRCDWSTEDRKHFVETVAAAAGDDEVKDRVRVCDQTDQKLADGMRITGLPALRRLLGKDVADRINEWLRPSGAGERGNPNLLAEMNEKYAVIRLQGKTRIATLEDSEVYENYKVPVFQRKDDFLLFESDRWVTYETAKGEAKRVSLGQWWLNHPERRKCSGVTFAPGPSAEHVSDKWNLWTGFGHEAREGDCSLYLAHLLENICAGDDEHFEYLLNWMARAVQCPDLQGEVAVVLRGDEGTGKGTFAREFGRLFGSHFVHVSQPKHLTGDFNKHLWNCAVLFADEALFAANRAHAPILKALITEETLMVTPKGIDSFQARNFLHIIMASNEDFVVPAGPDARRYFVLDVSRAPIEKPDDEKFGYFEAIRHEMENGGRDALLHQLQTRDLTGFNVRKVPQTNALADQKVLSLDSLHRWWLAVLDRGVVWNSPFGNPVFKDWMEFCTTQLLYESYKQWHRETRSGYLQTIEQMGTMLGKVYDRSRPRGSYAVGELERPDRDLATTDFAVVWRERPSGFQLGDLPTARSLFALKHGFGDRWTDDDSIAVDRPDKPAESYDPDRPVYFVDPADRRTRRRLAKGTAVVVLLKTAKKATRKVAQHG